MVTAIAMGVMFTMVLMAMSDSFANMQNLMAFIDIPSAQIVIFSTIAGGFASYPLKRMMGLPSVIMKILAADKGDPTATIKLLVEFAEKARKEGILALEGNVARVTDDFLKRGIQLAVDGTDPGLIRDILKTDISGIESRHEENASLLEYLAALAPAMGMIGTFVGLVLMLGQMSDISTLGPNMAIAVLTSVYGALMANCLFNPMARILKAKSKGEILIKNIMVEGIMSIQAGDNPRIVEQKLAACLDPMSRIKAIKKR
ncbi:MAG: MotA/TolQ/ExbB proton channel family protein [Chitinivibrionia bacterium]|nr:MotA/TolQ/ExbB proton channel family protein [Chitinivibrionia bacterium]